MKWKKIIAIAKEISRIRMYESLIDEVYPRYFVIDPRAETLSGFREHSVHFWIGFGMFG